MRVYRIILLLFLFSLIACQAPGPATLSQEDIDAIRATTETFVENVNAGNWEGLAALYTEDGVMMPPNQPAVEGRDNIKPWFEAFPPVSDFDLEVVEVEGRGDLAYVRGTYSMMIEPEGGDPIEDSGKYIEIRKKSADGSWLLSHDIFNSDVAMTEH